MSRVAQPAAAPNGCGIQKARTALGRSLIAWMSFVAASDQNTVFADSARGNALSPRDAEQRFGLGRGRGRDVIETDVPASRVQSAINPRTGRPELRIRGDVPLQNATITRRRD